MANRIGLIGLAIGGALALAGCADGYGYGGVSGGYGVAGGYGDGYYDGYGPAAYGGYGSPYGYGESYFGWYGDYYYPGTGVYVFDRNRRPYRWNDGQRRYWEGRRGSYGNGQVRNNWNGFARDGRRDYRDGRTVTAPAYRGGAVNRGAYRGGQGVPSTYTPEQRAAYREQWRANRAAGGQATTPGAGAVVRSRPQGGGYGRGRRGGRD